MFKPAISIIAACLLGVACNSGAQEDPIEPKRVAVLDRPPAPDFTGITNWYNSSPLNLQQLKGKVVLVEFWTYDCINCIHVLPHVKEWHERYKDKGLTVVGVHTPEYAHERIPANLERAIKRFNIKYPVAQDNGYKTWNAFHNRYWPALYLIDQDGRIAYRHFGEGAYAKTEKEIRRLLAQSPKVTAG